MFSAGRPYWRVMWPPTKRPSATQVSPSAADARSIAATTPAIRPGSALVPRAVPIVEAMAALVLLDHWMRHFAQNRLFKF